MMANNDGDCTRTAVEELRTELHQYMMYQHNSMADLHQSMADLHNQLAGLSRMVENMMIVGNGANRKVNHGCARDGVVPPIQPAMGGSPAMLCGFHAHATFYNDYHKDKKFEEMIHKPPYIDFRHGDRKEKVFKTSEVVGKTLAKIGEPEIIEEDSKKVLEIIGSSDEKEVLENIETIQISSSEFRKEPQEEISNHKIHRRIDLVPSKISANFPQFNGSLDNSDIWPGKTEESLCDEEDENIYDNLGCMSSTKFTLFIHAKYDPYDVEREIKGGAYIAVLLGEMDVSRVINDFDMFQYYFPNDTLNLKINSRTSFFSAGEFDVGQEAYIFRDFTRCRKITTFDPGGDMRDFTYARGTYSRFTACSTT